MPQTIPSDKPLPRVGILLEGLPWVQKKFFFASTVNVIFALLQWTSDDDVQQLMDVCGAGESAYNIEIFEHKSNGKGRGIAMVDFYDEHTASAVKRHLEQRYLCVLLVHGT